MESVTIPGATSILPYSNIATIYIEIYIVFVDDRTIGRKCAILSVVV